MKLPKIIKKLRAFQKAEGISNSWYGIKILTAVVPPMGFATTHSPSTPFGDVQPWKWGYSSLTGRLVPICVEEQVQRALDRHCERISGLNTIQAIKDSYNYSKHILTAALRISSWTRYQGSVRILNARNARADQIKRGVANA